MIRKVRLCRGALLDEGFRLCADCWFGREGDRPSVQHHLVPQQLRLRATITKGPPPKQHLVQDDAQRPDVHLPTFFCVKDSHTPCSPHTLQNSKPYCV